MSDFDWNDPAEGRETVSRAGLPRLEELRRIDGGYERRSVEEAFAAFYRHAAELDASLRVLESVDAFRRDSAALRDDLRALRAASWGPLPAARQAWGPGAGGWREERRVLPDSVGRMAVEVALIVAVAVAAGVSGLAVGWVIAIVLAAWIAVAAIEYSLSLARPRASSPATSVPRAGRGGRAPAPAVAEPLPVPVAAPVPAVGEDTQAAGPEAVVPLEPAAAGEDVAEDEEAAAPPLEAGAPQVDEPGAELVVAEAAGAEVAELGRGTDEVEAAEQEEPEPVEEESGPEPLEPGAQSEPAGQEPMEPEPVEHREQVEEHVPVEEPVSVVEPVSVEEPVAVEEPVSVEEPVAVEEPVSVEEPEQGAAEAEAEATPAGIPEEVEEKVGGVPTDGHERGPAVAEDSGPDELDAWPEALAPADAGEPAEEAAESGDEAEADAVATAPSQDEPAPPRRRRFWGRRRPAPEDELPPRVVETPRHVRVLTGESSAGLPAGEASGPEPDAAEAPAAEVQPEPEGDDPWERAASVPPAPLPVRRPGLFDRRGEESETSEEPVEEAGADTGEPGPGLDLVELQPAVAPEEVEVPWDAPLDADPELAGPHEPDEDTEERPPQASPRQPLRRGRR